MLNIAGYALLPLFSASLGMTATPGVVAGFAAALFPLYGQREMSRGRDEWLAALIGVLLTLYALRLARGETLTRRSALAYGAGWGGLMYVHPAMVVIFPLHMLVVLFARMRPSAQRMAFAGIVPVTFLLVILPWVVRDRIAVGEREFNRQAMVTAISWIESHPARFADLTFRRVIAFWAGEPPNRGCLWCARFFQSSDWRAFG
jgi:hypothetical protein